MRFDDYYMTPPGTDGPMVAELGLRNELEGVVSRLLRLLAELASAERPAADIPKWQARATAALQRVERAIELLRKEEEQGAGSQARFGRAVDWILLVLDQEDRPLSEDDLVQRVLDLGFAAGEGSDKYRKGRVTRSISMYLSGIAGERQQVLKCVGGLIGRGEWPGERFK